MPIEVDGRTVVAMVRLPVQPRDRVRLVWRQASATPVQGVCLKLDKGTLTINGEVIAEAVLWRDTSPDEVLVECNSKAATELRVWNCWRNKFGSMDAWIGNAGMRVKQPSHDRLTVECNSRLQITFEDLMFDMIVEHARL